MELKNVVIYSPEKKPVGDAFLYFCSEDGKDFYDSLDKFTKKYKLCIDPDTGIVRSVAEDVSRLYPAGFTVVETDVLPDGFDIYGGWCFINGKVKPVPVDYQAKAEETRKKLLNDADNIIRDWRTELTLGTISDENKAVLILWMNYINTLKSLDISNVTTEAKYKAIKWPEVPDVA